MTTQTEDACVLEEVQLPQPYKFLNGIVQKLLATTFDKITDLESEIERERQLGRVRERDIPACYYAKFFSNDELKGTVASHTDANLQHVSDTQVQVGGLSNNMCFVLFVQAQQQQSLAKNGAYLLVNNLQTSDLIFASKLAFEDKNVVSQQAATTTNSNDKAATRPASKKSKAQPEPVPAAASPVPAVIKPDQEYLMKVSKLPDPIVKNLIPKHTFVAIVSNLHFACKVFMLEIDENDACKVVPVIDFTIYQESGFVNHVNISDDGRFVCIGYVNGSVHLHEIYKELVPQDTPQPAATRDSPSPTKDAKKIKINAPVVVQKPVMIPKYRSRMTFVLATTSKKAPLVAMTHFLVNYYSIKEMLDVNSLYKMHDEKACVEKSYNRELLVGFKNETTVCSYNLLDLVPTTAPDKQVLKRKDYKLASPVTCIATNSTTELFCTGSANGAVIVWDSRLGIARDMLTPYHVAPIKGIIFCTKTRGISFSEDGQLYIFELTAPNHEHRTVQLINRVNCYFGKEVLQQVVAIETLPLFVCCTASYCDVYDLDSAALAACFARQKQRSKDANEENRTNNTVKACGNTFLEYSPSKGLYLYNVMHAMSVAYPELELAIKQNRIPMEDGIKAFFKETPHKDRRNAQQINNFAQRPSFLMRTNVGTPRSIGSQKTANTKTTKLTTTNASTSKTHTSAKHVLSAAPRTSLATLVVKHRQYLVSTRQERRAKFNKLMGITTEKVKPSDEEAS